MLLPARLSRFRRIILFGIATAMIGAAALFSFDKIRLSLDALRSYFEVRSYTTNAEIERLRLEGEIQLRDQEIAFLKEALGVEKTTDSSFLKVTSSRIILARVLATSPAFLRHTLVLDKGETEGIEPGMIVFLPPNRYVGRIEEVRERTSLARTVLHSEARLFGRAKENKAYGVVKGSFGTGIIFSGLAETGVPKLSEEVTSVGSTMQDGMVLGTVAETFHKADVLKFEARLIPAFEGLPRFVFLIKP